MESELDHYLYAVKGLSCDRKNAVTVACWHSCMTNLQHHGTTWIVVLLGPVSRERQPSTRSNSLRTLPATLSLLPLEQSSDSTWHSVPVQQQRPPRAGIKRGSPGANLYGQSHNIKRAALRVSHDPQPESRPYFKAEFPPEFQSS